MIAEPIAILANAGSGRRGAARIAELVRPFAAAGLGVEIRRIDRGHRLPDEARRLRDAGFGTVIAAGGDGTVTAVAQALAGTDTVLGVLPLGTFNFFARSIGLPPTPDAAAAALIGGRAQALDLAEVNGKVFLNNASLGLYPAMLADREQAYARWGRSRLAAYWSALRTLVTYDRSSDLRLTVDGRTARVRSPMVFVAANAYQLDQYGLEEGAEIVRQGRLALYIAKDAKGLKMLRFATRMVLRSARPWQEFLLSSGQEITIETRAPRRTVARDGERGRLSTPLHFRLRPGALKVIVPQGGGQG
ncbi:MAG: NAD(+)/NADH kinase [Rhodobacteraceae bacterium]|jgi:diacylglycerol kinase family enzyme|nr:NAD(+)/NADH kinase [Paracoccaceae bacterium]